MPDISMCSNDECPLKNSCYRFMATPSEYMQSYTKFNFEVKNNHIMCNHFVKYYGK